MCRSQSKRDVPRIFAKSNAAIETSTQKAFDVAADVEHHEVTAGMKRNEATPAVQPIPYPN